MSEALYIFDIAAAPQFKASTPHELMRAIEALQEKKVGVNQRFLSLATALEQRFPTREQMQNAQENGEDSVWDSSPLREAQQEDEAVWNFGLPYKARDEVTLAVVELAGPLGLGVYDDQLGLGFLPNDVIVPASRRTEWQREVVRIVQIQRSTLANVHQRNFAVMERFLGELGFKPAPMSNWATKTCPVFEREVAAGKQRLDFLLQLNRGSYKYTVTLKGAGGLFEAIRIETDTMGTSGLDWPWAYVVQTRYVTAIGSPFWADIPVDFPKQLKAMLEFVRDRLMPVAEKLSTLRGIHDYLRETPELNGIKSGHPRRNGYTRLISAWLFDSNYEEEVSAHREAVDRLENDKERHVYQGHIERLVAHLEAKVPRLV